MTCAPLQGWLWAASTGLLLLLGLRMDTLGEIASVDAAMTDLQMQTNATQPSPPALQPPSLSVLGEMDANTELR